MKDAARPIDDGRKQIKKDNLLKESKVFCMLPWVHLQVDPDGAVKPCCLTPFGEQIGSLKDNTLEECWNSEGERELRRNMLQGKESDTCVRCYEHEGAGSKSFRENANQDFGKHFDRIVTTTQEDGTVPELYMKYMDFRFSNVCNFRCRSCGPQLSSRWHADTKKIWPSWKGPAIIKIVNRSEGVGGRLKKALDVKNAIKQINDDDWELIESLLPDLEEIYFAGGEPLIMEEHYRILKLLDDKKLYHVRLKYNTNFSQMKFKGQDVMKIWNKFKTVWVGASLDDSYERGEYIRKGQKWERAVENRKRMMKVCPDVMFFLSVTVSLMNVWHLPDFHREWIKKGFIIADDLHDNILLFPNYYRIQILPEEYKSKIRIKYKKYIEWLKEQEASDRAIRSFTNILTFLDQKDMTSELPAFREYTRMMDEIRGENFEETFPELKGIMDGPVANNFSQYEGKK